MVTDFSRRDLRRGRGLGALDARWRGGLTGGGDFSTNLHGEGPRRTVESGCGRAGSGKNAGRSHHSFRLSSSLRNPAHQGLVWLVATDAFGPSSTLSRRMHANLDGDPQRRSDRDERSGVDERRGDTRATTAFHPQSPAYCAPCVGWRWQPRRRAIVSPTTTNGEPHDSR